MKKTSLWLKILLFVIFILGIGIRLYDLKDPPLDFYATRQLRSALIARADYYRLAPGIDPETRRLASDLAALEIYEPPILEQIVGLTYLVIGSEQIWIARIYNALFWALGGLAIWALGKHYTHPIAIVLGLAFYFFLPFSVIASRSFQPEPWMVMWILLTTWALFRWGETLNWKRAILAGILGGMTMLVKVVAGFFVLPMLAAATLTSIGFRKAFRQVQIWCILLFMILPVGLNYMLLNPTGRSADFLSFWTVSLSGLILKSNFYADWLAMVQGLTGLMVLVVSAIGVALAEHRVRALLLALWIGYGLYGLVFPYQYTTHEYYHLPLVALVALSILPIADVALQRLKKEGWLWKALVAGVLLFASFYSLYVSRSILYAANYRNEPIAWRRVGEAIPSGHPFVGLTADYGMRLSYYGWRNMGASWPTGGDLHLYSLTGQGKLDTKSFFNEFTRGKDFFLVTAFSELDAQPELKELLYQNYPIYAQGDGFMLFDLRKPK